jgi:hypothetical protein
MGGLNLDKALAISDAIEDEEIARKLERIEKAPPKRGLFVWALDCG